MIKEFPKKFVAARFDYLPLDESRKPYSTWKEIYENLVSFEEINGYRKLSLKYEKSVFPLKFDPLDNYKLDKKLGKGGYGKVFAIDIDGDKYAIKIYNLKKDDFYSNYNMLNEVSKTIRCSHPNIIQILACGVHQKR